MAQEDPISSFLKSVEARAFKRTVYHVRSEDAALDIVQDSMIKLVEHYGHKTEAEWPLLFQRILSNATLDWFRRQKTHQQLFANIEDLEADVNIDGYDLLENWHDEGSTGQEVSAETQLDRSQTMAVIEEAIQELPARQREAFLLRYWEDMDVAETATVMGCSQGSVKTHCSRAVQALAKALRLKGFRT